MAVNPDRLYRVLFAPQPEIESEFRAITSAYRRPRSWPIRLLRFTFYRKEAR